MISRRQAFAPIAAAVTVTAPTLQSGARTFASKASVPDRYDEPLGIGLETWPYPAPVRWQQCSAGGQALRMAYMDIPPTGPAKNRTVVLLHGKNFDSSYWRRPIEDLTVAGFRVIVPDQIGFNKSSKPDIPYALDMLVGLTIGLLGSLQIDRVTLVGHSTGGLLAVRIAATSPQRIEQLVLEDPLGLIDYRRYIPPQSLATLVAAERRTTVASYRAFLRNLCPVLPDAELEPFVEWRMRLAQSGEYERFCTAAALTYQMIYREPVRDEFADIAAPTLMIVGAKDKSAPLIHYAGPELAGKMPSIPQAAPAVVASMHAGRLVVVPNVGHVPHLEAPDAFREHLLGFLAE